MELANTVVTYGCVAYTAVSVGSWLGWKWHLWMNPRSRRFTFVTYTGRYWRLNGSRAPLVASPLTDQLQNLHAETAKGAEVNPFRPRLNEEMAEWK